MKKSITKLMAICIMMLFSLWEVQAQNVTLVANTSSSASGLYGLATSSGPVTYTNGSGDQLITIQTISATINQKNLTPTSGCFGTSKIYLISSASGGLIKISLPNTGDYYLDKVELLLSSNSSGTGLSTANSNGIYKWIQSDGTTYSSAGYIGGLTGYDQYATICSNPITLTAVTGAKSLVFGRGTVGGTTFGGAEFRIWQIRVWTKQVLSCTAPDLKTVSGTTTISNGNSAVITLASSQNGVQYQLYDGATTVGSPQTGDGSSTLSWSVAPTSTKTYTVKTVAGTYCETTMGTATITVTQNVPTISLTSASGTSSQTVTVNNAITNITYSIADGTATTAAVTWTGTANANTPPSGITVSFSTTVLTISGTPSVIGSYGYTATTDGSPAAQASGTINVSRYATNDFVSVNNGNWNVTSNWNQWNGSALVAASSFPNSSTANVYIANGTEINVEASGKNVNNLTVEGTLTSSGSNTSIMYLNIYGDLTVNTGGFIGDVNNTSGDGYDGISLSMYGNNSKITGNGGSIYLGRLRTNLAGQTLTIDHDMTAIYYGSTNQGGHTVSVYPNNVDDTNITINAGKTLTLAPWSVIGTTTSSNSSGAYNFTVNVNGKLDVKDSPSPNAQTPSTVRSMIYGGTTSGKKFTLNIGNTGIVNVPQFYPNGTVSGGGIPIGSSSTINIASGGILNISQILDLRQSSQTITGDGTINLLAGAEVKIGNASGLNGQILTGVANYDSNIKFTFAGTDAQVTGSTMPIKVNNLSISNATGVSLSKATEISGILTVDAGSTLKNGGFTLTNNGTANINGAFQIDEGGWATGNNFVYGAAGSLIFNNSTGPYGVSGTPVYWPAASGPVNVTVQNTGGMELQVARTITGIFQTSAVVKNTYGNDLTVSGTVRLNGGGYFDNFSPTYSGTGSTLEYNTGSTYGVYNEWGSGSSVGYGVPQNVTVNNATTVNLSGSRNVNGTLALTSGSIATGSNVLTLNGAITGTGTINTGASGTLSFAGTSEQTLASANVSSGALNNLVISSASKLTTSGSLSASNLTINSDASGTGSLKGTLTSTNATVNQSFQHAGALRTWYVTPPVESATPSGMSIIKSYDETNNSWSANTSTMLAKVGYQVVPAGAANDIAFVGTLNSGNQTISLTGRTGSVDKAGFNLIGNPYPAYLNWDLVTASTPNTNSMRSTTMWYRTKNGGVYGFWTVNGDGIGAPATASKYIPPMQAFWVRAIEGGGSLALTSDMTTHAPASDKLLKAPAANQSALQLLRLQVSNGVNTDEAVIYFSAKASNDLDKIDAPKMSNENAAIPEIYTTLGTEHIVINAMNSIPMDQPVGLGFVPGSAASFSIKATEVSNLPSDVKVILKDNVTSVETDLTDGTASYQFSPETIAGDRFSVIFRSSSTTTALNNNNVNGTLIYWNNQQGLTLKTNDEKLMGSTLSVYNAVGQQLLSKKISGTTMNIEFPYAPDMYIVKINNVTTKVIVK